MSRRSSSSHALSSGVASEPSRCSIAGSNSTSSLASSRSVGISSMPGKSLSLSGEAGSNVHGARNVSSSRASWHCRARACAHHFAWLSGSASRLPTTSAADVASRSRHSRAAASVVGRESTCRLQILLKLSELGRSGSSRSVHENPQRVAQPVKQSRSQDLVIGKCEQARPQCQQMAREVPAVHRRNVERVAAVSETACRTSCRSGPGAVPGLPSCGVHSPCAR